MEPITLALLVFNLILAMIYYAAMRWTETEMVAIKGAGSCAVHLLIAVVILLL